MIIHIWCCVDCVLVYRSYYKNSHYAEISITKKVFYTQYSLGSPLKVMGMLFEGYNMFSVVNILIIFNKSLS